MLLLPDTQESGDKREAPEQETHAALLQYDILKNIFGHFSNNSNDARAWKETQGHLCQAALVCKAFLDPALDSLWRSMTTLLPLLKLLPTLQLVNGAYAVHDDIHDHHWAYMDSYGKRIKEFVAHKPAVSFQTYLQLSQLRGSSILPNLRRLHYPSDDPSVFSEAPIILSSVLETLQVDNSDSYDGSVIQPFLFMIAVKAPNLRHVSLGGSGKHWAKIGRFSQLSNLEISKPMDFDLLRPISTLPKLEHLKVDLMGCSIENMTPIFPAYGSQEPAVLFPQLKSWTVTGRLPVISFVTDFIGSDLVRILSVTLRRGDGQPSPVATGESRWSSFLQKVDRKWGRKIALLSLEEEPAFCTSDWPDLQSYKFDLWRFSAQGWSVPDPQLRKIVPMFSDLEDLCLTSGSSTVTSLTLSGLRILAESCPKLLYLQASLEIGSPNLLDGDVLSHGLKEILVSSQDILKDKALLARHLDRIFPSLFVEATQDSADAKGWREVDAFLLMFQGIREDERIRTGYGCGKRIL
ncbi:hypothetical protein FPV67DRAFT_1663755 [Lyophyllum atratum]|nr:hypothetical protein FPV67DRAFT_1663755 [Lyophyllum atratum]